MRLTAVAPRWHCPSCRAPLALAGAEAAWHCAACARIYPTVNTIPVLVDEPFKHLQRTRRSLVRYQARQTAALERATRLADGHASGTRRSIFQCAAQAYRANVDLAQAQLDTLDRVPGFEPDDQPEDPASVPQAVRHYGLVNLQYLRTDWAATPEGEEQVQAIVSRVRRQLQRFNPDGGSTTFLGAGTGRAVFECARELDAAIAVELCVSYADLFRCLTERPVTFGECHFSEPVSPDTVAMTRTAAMPPDREALPRIHYVIADASRLPLPDESQSAVVSIYFTDVMPLPALLHEVRRVLASGQAFIHLGPLHYHFDEIDASLTPEEVPIVAADHGFDLVDGEWFDLPFFRSSAHGSYLVHRVWSCGFVKR